MNKSGLTKYLSSGKAEVDQALTAYLPSGSFESGLIYEAIRYSLFAGGKRIRPILCLAACEAVGGQRETTLPFAAAIELIHTYSLVHDDLPAMDNDTYRRGQLTNHKVFGEGVAILAGDALLTAAFTFLSEKGLSGGVPPKRVLAVILELGVASGPAGMVGGQLSDIEAQGEQGIGIERLRDIHHHKTGALIRASVRMGGLLGGASPKRLSCLSRYGEKIGLAFQIADDLLDFVEESDQREGPQARGQAKDNKNKWTYPRVIGLEQSKKEACALVEEAVVALAAFGPEADPLRQIAHYVVEREG